MCSTVIKYVLGKGRGTDLTKSLPFPSHHGTHDANIPLALAASGRQDKE